MAVNRAILECWDDLNREMDAFLAQSEYNPAMRGLSVNVKAAVFGKNWLPTRSQSLDDLKKIVRNVKRTMFCGPNHVFCVSVTPKNKPQVEGREGYWEYEEGEAPWYIPKRSGAHGRQWDFELPIYRQYNMHIKTLFRGSTPPLYVFGRGTRDAQEVEACVGDTYVNELTMKFDEPVLLSEDSRVYDVHDNDDTYLKDEEGRVILRMSVHAADWVGRSQWEDIARARAAAHGSVWHPSAQVAASAQVAELQALLMDLHCTSDPVQQSHIRSGGGCMNHTTHTHI